MNFTLLKQGLCGFDTCSLLEPWANSAVPTSHLGIELELHVGDIASDFFHGWDFHMLIYLLVPMREGIFVLFFIVLFFEARSHCVALVDLELTET